MKELEIRVADALVLKPGDQVLLTMSRPMSMAEADEARHRLGQIFPDVKFAFASGVQSVTVLRAEATR